MAHRRSLATAGTSVLPIEMNGALRAHMERKSKDIGLNLQSAAAEMPSEEEERSQRPDHASIKQNFALKASA